MKKHEKEITECSLKQKCKHTCIFYTLYITDPKHWIAENILLQKFTAKKKKGL